MSDDLFGGGGGGGSDFKPPTTIQSSSPAFLLTSAFNNSSGEVTTSLSRTGTFPQRAFDERFPRILADIDAARGLFRPGFSQLRQSRLAQVSNARDRAIGNLRENLRRRRVLGSSFAEDAIIRAEREFGQAAAATEAQSFLEELEATQQLIGLESNQLFNALNRELAELGVVANFATSTADLFSRNAQFEAQLAAQEAASRGSFFGNLIGLGAGAGLSLLTAPTDSLFGRLFAPQTASLR